MLNLHDCPEMCALTRLSYCELRRLLIINSAALTNSYPETHKRGIGKKCKPRSDAT